MFTELYYHVIDHRRHELAKLYDRAAVRAWNGNQAPIEDLSTHFSQFPDTSHTIVALDVQPIQSRPDATGMLIVVSGDVQYELEEACRFVQHLIVEMDRTDGAFVILSDTTRTFQK